MKRRDSGVGSGLGLMMILIVDQTQDTVDKLNEQIGQQLDTSDQP